MSEEKDRIFFRNYSLVIGILAVMIVIFFALARVFGINEVADVAQRTEIVEQRTLPIGKVTLIPVETQAAVTTTGETVEEETGTSDHPGKQIYGGVCFACHGTGLPGVPQLGDAAAWSTRIVQGEEILYERAISGFTGSSGMPMPPKGGNDALSDDDVKLAVDYMIVNSQ